MGSRLHHHNFTFPLHDAVELTCTVCGETFRNSADAANLLGGVYIPPTKPPVYETMVDVCGRIMGKVRVS